MPTTIQFNLSFFVFVLNLSFVFLVSLHLLFTYKLDSGNHLQLLYPDQHQFQMQPVMSWLHLVNSVYISTLCGCHHSPPWFLTAAKHKNFCSNPMGLSSEINGIKTPVPCGAEQTYKSNFDSCTKNICIAYDAFVYNTTSGTL